MRDDVIGYLLKAPSAVAPCPDVAAWWPRHRECAAVWRNPMDCAIAAGFCADRVGWAFASGYQAALRALFPEVPDDRIAALCVTEADGNSPKSIRSTLRREGDGWRLDGAKRWTTLGPASALFFVAARDAAAGDRAIIRVARVAADAPGVAVQTMAPTRFVPEVPHARLKLDNVRVSADALLAGDGYTDYVKRFRTLEDLHVNAAILAYLVREARRLDGPRAWIERALAALQALRAIAAEDAATPATHVSLAGALAWSTALMSDAGSHWAAAPTDPAGARWARDRELLAVAGTARARRAERAWERLRPTSPAA